MTGTRQPEEHGPEVVRLLWIFGVCAAVLVMFSVGPTLWAMATGTPPERAFHWIWFPHSGFDLWCYTERFTALHQPAFFDRGEFPWNYPAPDALLYAGLYLCNLHGEDVLLSFPVYSVLATGGAAVLLGLLARRLRARGAAFRQTLPILVPAMFLSWPLYFAQQRGNLEALLWLLLAAGVLLARAGRWVAAGICLGLLAAFKLYPVLLLGLLVPGRRWRAMAGAVLSGIAVTVLGLWTETPNLSLSWAKTQEGLQRFVDVYTLRYDPGAIGYDHSIFGFVKAVHPVGQEGMSGMLSRYMLAAGAISVVVFAVWVVRLPFLNQVTALTVLSVVLPPTSFDYTLCALYVPWGLLLLTAAERGRRAVRWVAPVMVLYALLMAPETFLVWEGVLAAGQMKTVVLLGLLLVSLVVRWESGAEAVAARELRWA